MCGLRDNYSRTLNDNYKYIFKIITLSLKQRWWQSYSRYILEVFLFCECKIPGVTSWQQRYLQDYNELKKKGNIR